MSTEDIEVVSRAFYVRAFDDPLLGPVFRDVARLHERLDEHIPHVVSFWASNLLTPGTYSRGAFPPHVALNQRVRLERKHFDRWADLWAATVNEHHVGAVADRAVTAGRRFANAFERRLRGLEANEHLDSGRIADGARRSAGGGGQLGDGGGRRVGNGEASQGASSVRRVFVANPTRKRAEGSPSDQP